MLYTHTQKRNISALKPYETNFCLAYTRVYVQGDYWVMCDGLYKLMPVFVFKVPDERRSQLLRIPSRESMASTETYQSSATSMVHVQPQGGATAGDSDDEDYWNDDEAFEKSMPSHQFRSMRGLPSANAFKQGMRRTLKQRVHKSRGSIRSHSYDGRADLSDGSSVYDYEDDVLRDVPTNLTAEEFAELTNRRKSLKEMPTSITRKRDIR